MCILNGNWLETFIILNKTYEHPTMNGISGKYTKFLPETFEVVLGEITKKTRVDITALILLLW